MSSLTPVPLGISDTYRIIGAQFAPHQLIRDIAAPGDEDAVVEVLRLTGIDPTTVLGTLSLVPAHARPHGPGAGWALMAFTHPARPSRFTDGSFGVWYAGLELDTAIAETVFHDERLVRAFNEPPHDRPKQVLHASMTGMFADLRTLAPSAPALYAQVHHPNPGNYGPAQQLGAVRRAAGDDGILYHSARKTTPTQGNCIAVFVPAAIRNAQRIHGIVYQWNGHTIHVGPLTP